MKPFIILIWGFIFTQAVFAQSESMFKGHSLKNAGLSAYAIDAESGAVIYETPQVSLVPASVMKLMTTAAALEILGPGFQFHTQIGYSGKINSKSGSLEGDLILKGGCDPAFYSEYFSEYYKGTFESWAEAVLRSCLKCKDLLFREVGYGKILVTITEQEFQHFPIWTIITEFIFHLKMKRVSRLRSGVWSRQWVWI